MNKEDKNLAFLIKCKVSLRLETQVDVEIMFKICKEKRTSNLMISLIICKEPYSWARDKFKSKFKTFGSFIKTISNINAMPLTERDFLFAYPATITRN